MTTISPCCSGSRLPTRSSVAGHRIGRGRRRELYLPQDSEDVDDAVARTGPSIAGRSDVDAAGLGGH